jgi:hypothetical protein
MAVYTVCRPLAANLADAPAGATLGPCPYCGEPCYRLALEPDPLPEGWVAACTLCALKRSSHQREMDQRKAEREARVEEAKQQ